MSTDGKITTQCPACKSTLAVGSQHAGKSLKCPKCGKSVVVPEPTAMKGEAYSVDGFSQDDNWADGTPSKKPVTYSIRYAPDVVSEPFTAAELEKALSYGLLLPEMLFSETGTEQWRPLTFWGPRNARRSQIETLQARLEQNRLFYWTHNVLAMIAFLVGLVMIPLSTTTNADELVLGSGMLVAVCSVFRLTFLWINRHFRRSELLLQHIAEMVTGNYRW
jgi:predicted RNA-binding Zn-ribbon protein involved in translation (DUF1610 family)